MMPTNTTWNGEQGKRPLVFLRKASVEELCRSQKYELSDELEELLPLPQVSAEMFLAILIRSGKIPEAVELLAQLMLPRVALWWALRCYRAVKEDIRNDFEKDGLTPDERQEKRVQDMVAELSDTSDIEALIEEHHKVMEEQRREAEEQARALKPLNPAQVISLKLDGFRQAMEAIGLPLSPGRSLTAAEQEAQDRAEQSIVQAVELKLKPLMPPEPPPLPPELERVSGQRIFDKIREKAGAIKPALDKEMARHFPLKLKGLPPKPPQKKREAAVAAAERWLLAPTDANGQLACEAGVAAKGGPEGMLAYTAFWSSTNMATETGMAPANPVLPPLGVSKTLLQLALLEGGELDYDARYELFLKLGLACADGSSTWDEHGREVREQDPQEADTREQDMLRRRSGFGRD